MLVLFDRSTPAPLRHALKVPVIVEAVERGWERLGNGGSMGGDAVSTLAA